MDKLNLYSFYSAFSNHDNKDDAAIVQAPNKVIAIQKLKLYYKNANSHNVRKVMFNTNEVCIISDEY